MSSNNSYNSYKPKNYNKNYGSTQQNTRGYPNQYNNGYYPQGFIPAQPVASQYYFMPAYIPANYPGNIQPTTNSFQSNASSTSSHMNSKAPEWTPYSGKKSTATAFNPNASAWTPNSKATPASNDSEDDMSFDEDENENGSKNHVVSNEKIKEEEERKKREEEERKRKEEEERKRKEEEERKRKEEEERKKREEEERKRREEEERLRKEEEEERKRKEEEERLRKEEEERKKREEEEERLRKEEEERKRKEEEERRRRERENDDHRRRDEPDRRRNDRKRDYNDYRRPNGGKYGGSKGYPRFPKNNDLADFNFDETKSLLEKTENCICYSIEELKGIWNERANELSAMNIKEISKMEYSVNKKDRLKSVKTIDSHLEQITNSVKALLNKLTLENFENTSNEIQKLSLNSVTEYETIFELIHTKAIKEPQFSSMYASLCQCLNDTTSSFLKSMHKITKENDKYKWGVYVSTPQEEKSDLLTLQYNNAALFDTEEAAEDAFKKRFSPKNMLTRMCQKEFEKHDRYDEINKKLELYTEKLKHVQTHEEEIEVRRELMECDFEKNKIRSQTFGNIQFIGELFNHTVISKHAIISKCIEELKITKENPDEEKIECLVKLLTTIGLTCSKSAKFKELVDNAVQYLINLKNEKAVSSRVRFSIMDLCDLRANDWIDEKNKLQTKEDLRLQSTLKQLDKKDISNNDKRVTKRSDQVKLRPQTSGTKASEKSKEPVPLTESERSTYYSTIHEALKEYSSTTDYEDYLYYIQEKMKKLNVKTYDRYYTALFEFLSENCRLKDNNYNYLIDITLKLILTAKISTQDLLQGLYNSLCNLGNIDAPQRYEILATFLKALVEKQALKSEDIETVLTRKNSDEEFTFQQSKLLKQFKL